MVPRQSNERALGCMIRLVAPCPSLRPGWPSPGAIAARSAVRLWDAAAASPPSTSNSMSIRESM
jgi:hypothetical protein